MKTTSGPGAWIALACSVVVLGSVVISLTAADPEPPGSPILECGAIVEGTGEFGDATSTWETPTLAVLQTEWLTALDIAPEARSLSEESTPDFGLVEVDKAADGVVTDAESRGDVTSFLAYEDAGAVAQIFVERTPDGKGYWVAGTSSC